MFGMAIWMKFMSVLGGPVCIIVQARSILLQSTTECFLDSSAALNFQKDTLNMLAVQLAVSHFNNHYIQLKVSDTNEEYNHRHYNSHI
jgi:hypothetical protein